MPITGHIISRIILETIKSPKKILITISLRKDKPNKRIIQHISVRLPLLIHVMHISKLPKTVISRVLLPPSKPNSIIPLYIIQFNIKRHTPHSNK